jgi:hypothetical protein
MTASVGHGRYGLGSATRVLGLAKAFLKAGVLTEDRLLQDTTAGPPRLNDVPPSDQALLSAETTDEAPVIHGLRLHSVTGEAPIDREG